MKKLHFLIIFAIAPIYFWGQSLSYAPEGKMSMSRVRIVSLITTKLTRTGLGVTLVHIDTSQRVKAFPFYNILSSYLEKSNENSSEYFFLFNGSNKNFTINKHLSGELVGTELGESKRNGFKPISVYPKDRCRNGFFDFTLLPGQMIIIKVGHSGIIGDYKTRVQLRIRTSGNNIIYSPFYACAIDENCFSISTGYRNKYAELKGLLLTLQ